MNDAMLLTKLQPVNNTAQRLFVSPCDAIDMVTQDDSDAGDSRFSRRRIMQTTGAGAALLVAGCLSDDPAEPEDGDPLDGEDDIDDSESVFIEGMGANTSTLDVHGEPRVPNSIVHESIYETLFVMSPDLEVTSHLVDEWEVTDNADQFDFYLKEGINFHDGNELTAEMAAANFERMLDISPRASLLGPVESISAVDEYHLRFEYESSFPILTRNLTDSMAAILSIDAVEEGGDTYGQETAVGTGPFMFEQWDRDEQIILTRNDEYDWGPDFLSNTGPAHFEEIHFRHIPENTTLFNELTVGNVDGTTYVPTESANEVAEHENTSLERSDFPHPSYLAMNVTNPPTDELEVRQAIGHAVNRDAVIEAALDGEATPIRNIVPPLSFNALDEDEVAELGIDYDPEQAREILDSAGWTNDAEGEVRTRDGDELEVMFTAFTIDRYSQIGEVVQSMLGEVGFEVDLNVLEAGTLYDTLEGSEHNITTMSWSTANFALTLLDAILHGDNVATEGGSNYAIWDNEEFKDFIATAQSSGDENERIEAVKEAQRVVLNEYPVHPIATYTKHYGHKNEVDAQGWFDHPWWSNEHHIHRLEVKR